ncbi:MAG: hypothetical protein N2C14_08815, partial [Planctomycetales bacterium]
MLLNDAFSAGTHFGIAFLQSTFTHGWDQDSSITHAGLYGGKQNILESSGAAGLRSAQLCSKEPGLEYEFYRYTTSSRIADMAAWWAENLILTRKLDPTSTSKSKWFGLYTVKGTAGMLRSSKKGSKSEGRVEDLMKDPWKARGFYCSNFVCECYELATKGKSP